MTTEQMKVLRRYVMATIFEVSVVLAVELVLMRSVGPQLIDSHNDVLGWLGLACYPLAAILAVSAIFHWTIGFMHTRDSYRGAGEGRTK